MKTKENNLENVRELNKNAQITKRFRSSQLHTSDHELLQPVRKTQNFTVADGTPEMNIANVIQSFHDTFACITRLSKRRPCSALPRSSDSILVSCPE